MHPTCAVLYWERETRATWGLGAAGLGKGTKQSRLRLFPHSCLPAPSEDESDICTEEQQMQELLPEPSLKHFFRQTTGAQRALLSCFVQTT